MDLELDRSELEKELKGNEELLACLKIEEGKSEKEGSDTDQEGEGNNIEESDEQKFISAFLQSTKFPDNKDKLVREYNPILQKNRFTENKVKLIANIVAENERITANQMLIGYEIQEKHLECFIDAAVEWKKRKEFYSGLPPLGKRSGSSCGSSENVEHLEAKLDVKQEGFHLLKNVEPSSHFSSNIWREFREEPTMPWGSEADIQSYVKVVMKDAIRAANLRGKVSCMEELGIFRSRADIWIVAVEGFPIGVVEVKKPGKDIMKSNCVHGQILDYMLRLRNFYGQMHVFGIVSTYEEWRVYWLDKDDCKKAAEGIEVNTNNDQPLIDDIDCTPEWLEDIESKTVGDFTPPSREKRRLYGTPIFGYNNKNLFPLLASVLLKMYHSPRHRVPLVHPNRSYIVLNETSWYWGYFNRELNLSQMPAANTKCLILLRDYRGGIHGRVWLACNSSGNVCVIKFAKKKVDLLFHEQKIWNEVWELPAKIQRFGGKDALVMPFVKPCTKAEQGDVAVQEVVLKAIRKMAEKGYCHEDLSWRHVGLCKIKGKLTAVLFDVAETSPVTESLSAIEAIEKMTHTLFP